MTFDKSLRDDADSIHKVGVFLIQHENREYYQIANTLFAFLYELVIFFEDIKLIWWFSSLIDLKIYLSNKTKMPNSFNCKAFFVLFEYQILPPYHRPQILLKPPNQIRHDFFNIFFTQCL